MVKSIFKKFIHSIIPYEPGKPIEEVERELGIRKAVKLASNENPLGPSKKAIRAMREALSKVHLYPDGGCFYLKEQLSDEFKLSKNHFVIGNGSNEIIELLARGFVSPGDRVIASDQSFLVYPLITQVCGGEFVSLPMNDGRYDLEGIAKLVNDRTKIIFVSNPNNPTGTYVTDDEVEDFLGQIPKRIIVCFDEAYYDFVNAKDFPNSLAYIKAGRENIIILRTFSKSYGLAGLRIGYGIAHPDVVQYLDKVRQPFNVNQLAQVAACAALSDKLFLKKTQQLIWTEREYVCKELKKMGFQYLPSQANFILFNAGRDAAPIFQALLKKGIIVRGMKAYGLPNYLRVTIGKHSENKTFLKALSAVYYTA